VTTIEAVREMLREHDVDPAAPALLVDAEKVCSGVFSELRSIGPRQ
jgi:hypothetical protein